MTNQEIYDYFKNIQKGERSKTIVKFFNDLEVDDRISYIDFLKNLDNSNELDDFIDVLRNQAVADFWTHEQQLIKNGQCTRNWTPGLK